MQIADLPKIFRTDIIIKTTRGSYYRHYISCGKKNCPKCSHREIGHPYFYFYPLKNDNDQVFYLKKDYYGRIHIWGKVISRFPENIESQKSFRIYNKEGRGTKRPLMGNLYQRDRR